MEKTKQRSLTFVRSPFAYFPRNHDPPSSLSLEDKLANGALRPCGDFIPWPGMISLPRGTSATFARRARRKFR